MKANTVKLSIIKRIRQIGAILGLGVISAGSLGLTIGLPAPDRGEPDGSIVLVCFWLIRLVAAWLLLSVATAMTGALIDRSRAAPQRAFVIGPRTIGRLATLAVRGSLVAATVSGIAVPVAAIGVAAVAAPAVPSHPRPHPHPHQKQTQTQTQTQLDSVGLGWPVNAVQSPEVAPPATAPSTVTSMTTTTSQSSRPRHSGPSNHPSTGHRTHPTDHGAAPRRPRQPAPQPRAVVVAPGDTLWSIAAAQLPPGASVATVVTAWHGWWDANRSVIGPDPSLIYPGQHLRPPKALTPTPQNLR